MTRDMFANVGFNPRTTEHYYTNVTVLRAYASTQSDMVLRLIETHITPISPFRHMKTRRGYSMSAEITNCGQLGWITDAKGYRYVSMDPVTEHQWPAIPDAMYMLAQSAAIDAGYSDFEPDSCIINRYVCGAKMALHQDIDEQDFTAPIVSFSFGLPAIFLLGGLSRQDKTIKIPLFHGDVIVWGGQDRLRFHGVAPIKSGYHDDVGAVRINLTFRKAG